MVHDRGLGGTGDAARSDQCARAEGGGPYVIWGELGGAAVDWCVGILAQRRRGRRGRLAAVGLDN